MKRNLWLQILLASMAINLIGALIRLSGAKDIGTYILWFGMTVFLVAIGGLVVKIFQRPRSN
jgi:hypothetical protein